MSAPSSSSAAEALAAAAQARAEAARRDAALNPAYGEDNHEMRQRFRRLIDPGIMKHNDKKSAGECFNTLLTLADNLAKDPNNPKFQTFKTTNKLIKRTLLDVKGGLEYVVELGFRLDVQDLQPVYVFHPTPARLTSLRVGAEVIREVTAARAIQEAREAEAAKAAKAAKEAAVKKAMLAYEEDRQAVRRRNEREHAAREAAAARAAADAAVASPTSRSSPMPISPRAAAPFLQSLPEVPHQPAPSTRMPGEMTTQDEIQEHNEYGLDEEMDQEAEEEDADDAEGDEDYIPPQQQQPATRSRRNRRRFPGGGNSLAGNGEGDAAESDSTAVQGEEAEEDMPPPYGAHQRPSRAYPGAGRRLGD